jgi:LAGLIDADG-like domain
VRLHDRCAADHRVELTNGEVIYCHGHHEWAVVQRVAHGEKLRTMETQELMRGRLSDGQIGKRGHFMFHLPLVSPLLGEEKVLPVDPYVLGVWLGDGTTTAADITYHVADAVIVEAVEACGYVRGATHGNHRYPNLRRTTFLGLRVGLRLAGVFAEVCGVRTKHIPEVYLTASLRQRIELLAGLIDTDGYVYGKNGRVVFVTGDERLKDTFCHLLATFGWSASVDTVAPKLSSSGIQGKKDCYYIGFQPTIQIPCRIPRKQMHISAVRRRVAIKSITVEPDNGKVANCIMVDAPDGLYLVGHTMQPTHNSWAATDFIAWVAGKQPDRKTIFGSYSDDLGVRTNNDLQRIITSERFKQIFPGTKISEEAVSSGGFDRWKRNSSLIEFIGREGSFRNTTVSGQINGLELHLGVIDDPIKGREEAHRVNARNKAWEWFADDFMSRFAKDGALLVVMTRWHTDDILGASWSGIQSCAC